MMNRKIPYLPLGQERQRRMTLYFLSAPPMGPLLLLWIAGLSVFLFLGQGLMGLGWTAFMALAGLAMIRSHYQEIGLGERFTLSCLRDQITWKSQVGETQLRVLEASAVVLARTAGKLDQLARTSGAGEECAQTLNCAAALFSFQVEVFRQAEALSRGLDIVASQSEEKGGCAQKRANQRGDTVAAVQRQMQMARELVGEISEQLDTLLLQIFQLEMQQDSFSGAAELALKMEAEVAKTGAKVTTLQQASTLLVDVQVAPDLKATLGKLQQGFTTLESVEGLEALKQLNFEYSQVQSALMERQSTGGMFMAQVPSLIEETFRQGLGVLGETQGLLQTIKASDRQRLEQEVSLLERDVQELQDMPEEAVNLHIKVNTLEARRELLQLIEQQTTRVEGLLLHCERCRLSLARTRMLMADLNSGVREGSIADATASLQTAIDQAKEVQEEMRRLGY